MRRTASYRQRAGLAGLAASLAPAAAQSPGRWLSGTVTVWHSYGSGAGTEPDAFNATLDHVKAANPGLTVNVAPQPFNNIFDNWKLEVASGGDQPGPDDRPQRQPRPADA